MDPKNIASLQGESTPATSSPITKEDLNDSLVVERPEQVSLSANFDRHPLNKKVRFPLGLMEKFLSMDLSEIPIDALDFFGSVLNDIPGYSIIEDSFTKICRIKEFLRSEIFIGKTMLEEPCCQNLKCQSKAYFLKCGHMAFCQRCNALLCGCNGKHCEMCAICRHLEKSEKLRFLQDALQKGKGNGIARCGRQTTNYLILESLMLCGSKTQAEKLMKRDYSVLETVDHCMIFLSKNKLDEGLILTSKDSALKVVDEAFTLRSRKRCAVPDCTTSDPTIYIFKCGHSGQCLKCTENKGCLRCPGDADILAEGHRPIRHGVLPLTGYWG